MAAPDEGAVAGPVATPDGPLSARSLARLVFSAFSALQRSRSSSSSRSRATAGGAPPAARPLPLLVGDRPAIPSSPRPGPPHRLPMERDELPALLLRCCATGWCCVVLCCVVLCCVVVSLIGGVEKHTRADPSLAQPSQRGRLQRPAAVLRQPLLSCFSVVAHRAGARVREAALPHRLSAAHMLAWPSRVVSFSLKHKSSDDAGRGPSPSQAVQCPAPGAQPPAAVRCCCAKR